MKRQVRLQNAPAWVIGTISGIVFAIVFTGLQALTGTVPIGIVALVGAVFEALFFLASWDSSLPAHDASQATEPQRVMCDGR
jgi:hypothetical protein